MVLGRSIGSPGPGEMTTASGPAASISAPLAEYGSTVTSAPSAHSCATIARFTPQSEHQHPRPGSADRNERILRRRDRCHQPDGSVAARILGQQRLGLCEGGLPDRERRRDRSVLPQRDRQRARVRSRQRRNALLVEPRAEIAAAGVMRGLARETLDHGAGDARAIVLHRGPRDPVVADHRIGEREDLSGVRRIGQRLFVPRHPGVEDRLAQRHALHRQPFTVVAGAVGKKQRCVHLPRARHAGIGASTPRAASYATRPPTSVASTFREKRLPSNGVFFPLE